MRKPAAATILVGTTVALVLLAPSAMASCGQPLPYEEAIDAAPAVFVGSVIELDDAQRRAVVDVGEVWKGEGVPGTVDVWGGPPDPSGGGGTWTSVDRSYELGETYLFVPFATRGDAYKDNACTRTSVYRADLERFRPAAAVSPTPSGSLSGVESEDHRAPGRRVVSDFQWFMTGFFTAILVAFGIYATRRGRTRHEEGA